MTSAREFLVREQGGGGTASLAKPAEREETMAWYFWVMIGWGLSGLIALAMEFHDNPSMRVNIGWAEVWPVVLGPVWLLFKVWEWAIARAAR